MYPAMTSAINLNLCSCTCEATALSVANCTGSFMRGSDSNKKTGVTAEKLTELKSVAFVPAEVVAKNLRAHWDKNIFVIPEYSFAFECNADPTISREHCEYQWLPYDMARKLLKWDSNKVAMYEIMCRLRNYE